MLVSRQFSSEKSHWSTRKIQAHLHHSPEKIRMSNHYDAPPAPQPERQGQYSLPPANGGVYTRSYSHEQSSTGSTGSQTQSFAATTLGAIGSSGFEAAPLNQSPEDKTPTPDTTSLQHETISSSSGPEQQDTAERYTQKPEHGSMEQSPELPSITVNSDARAPVSSAGQAPETSANSAGTEDGQASVKEEEEEVLEDEEMADAEEVGEEEVAGRPMTAAERTAARRKMKRFRLTHQQTRFLMSEFAKQPHPDASHRERLSREIPGLSPRQVQVWFQNRRAKIKRLTVDDRERMIRMRAVPDDFDNVQALHSPYGAVHAMSSMPTPVDYGPSPYGEPLIRPMSVDVRRSEGESHHMISPGLSPGYGSMAFNHSASLGASEILSPVPPITNDRYGYPSPLQTPLSASLRPPFPYPQPGSGLDSGMQMARHGPTSHARPLQPLHRETLGRARTDSMNSPLRSSMSWKGDAIDYTNFPRDNYRGDSVSPEMNNRQASLYPGDQMSNSSGGGGGSYEPSNYSASTAQSPQSSNYPQYQPSSLPQSQQPYSRLRAASASLPLGLDLRIQYRPASSSLYPSMPSPAPRSNSGSHLAPGPTSYSASFPSTPLTAPMDFSIPRTPSFRSGHDYNMPQMSAPIAPPADFSQALQGSGGGGSAGGGSGSDGGNGGGVGGVSSAARAPMRDAFGGLNMGVTSQPQASTTPRGANDFSEGAQLGERRRPSFTINPPSVCSGAAAGGIYGPPSR